MSYWNKADQNKPSKTLVELLASRSIIPGKTTKIQRDPISGERLNLSPEPVSNQSPVSQESAPVDKTQALAAGAQMAGGMLGGDAGGVLSGAGSGASTGMAVGGHIGAGIGAGAGALMGIMQARNKRKAAARAADAQAQQNISQIEQNLGEQQSAALRSLMQSLGSRRL